MSTLAWALEFEGVDLVALSSSDADLEALWSGTDWTTFHYGLELPGGLSRSLDFLAFSLSPAALELALVDVDNSLANLFATHLSTALTTHITSAVARDAATINVESTTGFASTGTLYVGNKAYSYGGTGPTSFTTVANVFPWAGAASWAGSYSISSEDGWGAEITSAPRTWKGRGVTVYRLERDADGAWCTRANALKWFVGVLDEDPSYAGDAHTWSLRATSAERRCERSLLRDQFTATAEGFYVPEESLTVEQMTVDVSGASDVDQTTITFPAGTYTGQTVLAKLVELIETERAGLALPYPVTANIYQTPAGWRTKITMAVPEGTFGYRYAFRIYRDGGSHALLAIGCDQNGVAQNVGCYDTDALAVTWWSSKAPIRTMVYQGYNATLTVVESSGTWTPQPWSELGNAAAEGYIYADAAESRAILSPVSPQGSDTFLLCSYDAGTCTFTIYNPVNARGEAVAYGYNSTVLTYDDPQSVITLRQAWITRGRVSDVLLRLLLSTGTADYNDATYDKWPAQMGLAIPSTIVDKSSIRALDTKLGAAADVSFIMAEPTAGSEVINSLMASCGFHLAWRDGAIGAVAPFTPSGTGTADWTITADEIIGHSVMAPAPELMTSRLTLKYNWHPFEDEYQATETYDNLSVQDADEEPASIEVEGRYVRGDSSGAQAMAWRQMVAVPMLAFFNSLGLRRLQITATRDAWGCCPGDVVLITDSEAPDHTLGVYGITNGRAIVESVTENPEDETVSLSLLALAQTYYAYGPSGMLDYERGDGGYDSGGPTIYLRENEFSQTSDGYDVDYFASGDRLRVVEADPSISTSFETYLVIGNTVTPASHKIDLNSTFATFNTAKRYIVEYDDYATLAAASRTDQLLHAFLASDTDRMILDTIAAMRWGVARPTGDPSAVRVTDGIMLYPDVTYADGEPLSAHKAAALGRAVNNLKAHAANPQPLGDAFAASATITGTVYGIAWGPGLVRVAPQVNSLTVRLWVSVAAGTGTYRVTASVAPPTGDFAAPSWGAISRVHVTGTTTSTSWEQADITLPLWDQYPLGDRTVWLVVESKNSGANATHLRGVAVWCDPPVMG